MRCPSLEQQGRIVTSPPTIATVLEKPQSALQKSRIDRTTTRPPAEGWSCFTLLARHGLKG